RGGVGAVVNPSKLFRRCHRAHDENGTPATSWPPAPRATDGLKFVVVATGGGHHETLGIGSVVMI
ncbi:hypothetical protein RA280_48260, partial [Cupriavidus sp. CV2]|uniref:hypothetical protein n=1 Tax=Cupriavidus ulmosensis TaxID=3065913 RepID=UPI00296B4BD3